MAMAEPGVELCSLNYLADSIVLSQKGHQDYQGRFPNLAVDQNHLTCFINCRVLVLPLEILSWFGTQTSPFLNRHHR